MYQSPQQLVIYPNHKLLLSFDTDNSNRGKITFYITIPEETRVVEDSTVKTMLVEDATLAAMEAVVFWRHGRRPRPTTSKHNYSVGELP